MYFGFSLIVLISLCFSHPIDFFFFSINHFPRKNWIWPMRAKAHESHSIPEDLCGDKYGLQALLRPQLSTGHVAERNVASGTTSQDHGLPYEECRLEG